MPKPCGFGGSVCPRRRWREGSGSAGRKVHLLPDPRKARRRYCPLILPRSSGHRNRKCEALEGRMFRWASPAEPTALGSTSRPGWQWQAEMGPQPRTFWTSSSTSSGGSSPAGAEPARRHSDSIHSGPGGTGASAAAYRTGPRHCRPTCSAIVDFPTCLAPRITWRSGGRRRSAARIPSVSSRWKSLLTLGIRAHASGQLEVAQSLSISAQWLSKRARRQRVRASPRPWPVGGGPRRVGWALAGRLTARGGCYNFRGNMELKLRKIGNSLGVILPAEVLKVLQVREGSSLTLIPNERGEGFQLVAEDAEFEAQMRAARSLLSRYSSTLRELAK